MHDFFVVRYSELGSHWRVRVLTPQPHDDNSVLDLLQSPGAPFYKRSYRILAVPYAPEIERYGGKELIGHCESAFCASTKFVRRELTAAVSRDRGRRLGLAAVATLAHLRTLTHSTAEAVTVMKEFHDGYIKRWGDAVPASGLREQIQSNLNLQASVLPSTIASLWQILDVDSMLPSSVRHLLAALRTLDKQCRMSSELPAAGAMKPVRANLRLAPSLIHMTNNRLGVSPPEEMLLAAAISRFLQDARNVSRVAGS